MKWPATGIINAGFGCVLLTMLGICILISYHIAVESLSLALWELYTISSLSLLGCIVIFIITIAVNRSIAELSTLRVLLDEARADHQRSFDNPVEGVFQISPDFRYVQANLALARICGYDTAEAFITAISSSPNYRYVEPGRRDTLLRMLQQQDAVQSFESPVYHKNGSIIWIAENVYPVHDAHGVLRYYEGFVRDITAHRKAQQALHASVAQQHALLNALPDLMFRINQEGIFLDYKAAKDVPPLQEADEYVGKHVQVVFPPHIAESLLVHVRQALATESPQIFEYQHTLNRVLHDYEVRIVVSGANEVLAIVRDISDRKRAERLKSEFVSIVSHELRTPLTSIRGSLGLIAGGVAGKLPAQVENMVQIAHKNSERLVSLVNDILDIDKIESGQMVFQVKPTELLPLVEQALEANRTYGEQYQVTFVLTQTIPGVKVNVDNDRLIQVLTNLLSNAAKFSPSGSSVEIAITRVATRVRVSVTDRGAGIPEEFRSRIFQRFAQADSSDTRHKSGTGLGLSISKAIIEKLGGTIGFTSKIDEGTTFFFELPEWRDIVAEQIKPRILVCEDTPDIAMLLSTTLNRSGFTTDVAYNAEQAKQMLTYNQYAAMTLDLVMPGQSGISLIRELRSREETRDLPIIVVSALAQYNREELESNALAVVDWLDKPIDLERLLTTIRAATRRPAGNDTDTVQILHVEDDSDVIEVVAAILGSTAQMAHATTIEDARRQLEERPFDIIILDMSLPDGSGLELLPLLHHPTQSSIPVVIFSAREIDTDIAPTVVASLVKSRTSNQELLNTIRSLIHMA